MSARSISFEGQLLHIAGNSGEETGIAVAKDMIDGATNALVRLEGAQAAAEFAFALSDRVVAKVGVTTATLLPAPAPPSIVPAPAKPESSRMGFWYIFICGWALGFIVGLWARQG